MTLEDRLMDNLCEYAAIWLAGFLSPETQKQYINEWLELRQKYEKNFDSLS